MKLTDLRGILQYIPQFREKTFVISIDGAIVTSENFANLLTDIAERLHLLLDLGDLLLEVRDTAGQHSRCIAVGAVVALFGALMLAVNSRDTGKDKQIAELQAQLKASEEANDELEQENKEYLALIVTLQAGDPAALEKMKVIVANILRGRKGYEP